MFDSVTLDSQLLAQCLEFPSDNITGLRVFCLLLVTLLINVKDNKLFTFTNSYIIRHTQDHIQLIL